MYKVFVNDKPIILTSSLKKEETYPTYISKSVSFDEIIYKLRTGKHEGVHLYSTNLEDDWIDFKNTFKTITAAGGLVLNKESEILFIYRGNKWDLPKGRIEKGESIEETAIREVEEECGITDISIKQFLITTYHLFIQNGEHRLKETHWYLMNSTYEGELTPQLEEGITKVTFKNEEDTKYALQKTYSNIRLVHQSYKNV